MRAKRKPARANPAGLGSAEFGETQPLAYRFTAGTASPALATTKVFVKNISAIRCNVVAQRKYKCSSRRNKKLVDGVFCLHFTALIRTIGGDDHLHM